MKNQRITVLKSSRYLVLMAFFILLISLLIPVNNVFADNQKAEPFKCLKVEPQEKILKDSIINVFFNKEISRKSLHIFTVTFQDITSRRRVIGKYNISSDKKSFTFKPSRNLLNNRSYRLLISKKLKTPSGEMLDREYSFNYTVGTSSPKSEKADPLTITMNFPEDGSSECPINAKIIVSFSQPLDKSMINLFNFSLVDVKTGKKVFGSISYDEKLRTVSFQPRNKLDKDYKYEFRVSEALKSESKKVISGKRTFSFKTSRTKSSERKYIKRVRSVSLKADSNDRASKKIAAKKASQLKAAAERIAAKKAAEEKAAAERIAAKKAAEEKAAAERIAAKKAAEEKAAEEKAAREKEEAAKLAAKKAAAKQAAAKQAAAKRIAEKSSSKKADSNQPAAKKTSSEDWLSGLDDEFDSLRLDKKALSSSDSEKDSSRSKAVTAETEVVEFEVNGHGSMQVKDAEKSVSKAVKKSTEKYVPVPDVDVDALADEILSDIQDQEFIEDTQIASSSYKADPATDESIKKVDLKKARILARKKGHLKRLTQNKKKENLKEEKQAFKVLKIIPEGLKEAVNNKARFRVVFNRPLAADQNIKSLIEIRTMDNVPAAIQLSFISGSSEIVVRPESGFLSGRVYRGLVKKTIRSIDNSELAKDKKWYFRTKSLPKPAMVVKKDVKVRETSKIKRLETLAAFDKKTASEKTVSPAESKEKKSKSEILNRIKSLVKKKKENRENKLMPVAVKKLPEPVNSAPEKPAAPVSESREDSRIMNNAERTALLESLRKRVQNLAAKKTAKPVYDSSFPQSAGTLVSAVSQGVSNSGTLKQAVERSSASTEQPFTIIGHIPPSGMDGIPLESPVIVTFSADVDVKSLGKDTIRVMNSKTGEAVKGSFVCMGSRVVFKPAQGEKYLPETTYLCHVESSIKSKDSKSMESDFVWDFKTAMLPEKKILAEKIKKASQRSREKIEEMRAEFAELRKKRELEEKADASSENVASGLFSSNKSLGEQTSAKTAAATVDKAPSIKYVQPMHNSIDVLPETRVQVGFDGNIDPATVNQLSIQVCQAGQGAMQVDPIGMDQLFKSSPRISGNVYFDRLSKTAFFTPVDPFKPGYTYMVRINRIIKDPKGRELERAQDIIFTTLKEQDETPPRVVQIDPAKGDDNIPVKTKITVKFSEPVKEKSFTPFSVSLNNGTSNIMGTMVYSDKVNTLTFIPRTDLDYDTIYRVTVSSIEDIAGNSMASPEKWLFRTERRPDSVGPKVLDVKPIQGEDDVSPYAVIKARVNEPLDPVSVSYTAIGVWDGTKYIDGRVTYDEEKMELSFYPSTRLQNSTLYNAYVSRGIKDKAGNPMGEHFVWTFVTVKPQDRSRPMIVDIFPTIAAKNVSARGDIKVRFSETVNPASITWSTFGVKRMSDGMAVDGEITYDSASNTAVFSPVQRLDFEESYRAWVSTGIKDLAGNQLAQPADWAFMTEAKPDMEAPSILSVSPVVGSRNVPVNTDITVKFSEPLDEKSITPFSVTLQKNVGKQMITGEASYDEHTQTLIFRMEKDLEYETLYTVNISNSITDRHENNLERPFTYNFQTLSADFQKNLIDSGKLAGVEAFKVESVYPADNAVDVLVEDDIKIVFNKRIAADTINPDTLFVLDDMGRSISAMRGYDNVTKTVVVRPKNSLNYSTNYTVIITGGEIYDFLGHPLAEDMAFTFRTEGAKKPDKSSEQDNRKAAERILGKIHDFNSRRLKKINTPEYDPKDVNPPSVVNTSPVNGASQVILTPSIIVTFSEPMKEMTINDYTFTVDNGEKYIPGTVTYNGPTNKAMFNPKVKLVKGRTYRVTLSKDIKDYMGNSMVSPKVFTFTTLNPKGPKPIKIHPLNGKKDVNITSDIRAAFDKQILSLTLTPFNVRVSDGKQQIQGRISYDTFSHQMVFIPDKPLKYNTNYQVKLMPGIQDVSGNDIEEYSWSFQTAEDPADRAVNESPLEALERRF